MNVHSEEMVRDAAMFAAGAHAGQKYGKDEKPYHYHLQATVNVLHRFLPKDTFFVFFADIYASAWLHDTLEDTKVTHEDLRNYFGANVADIVDAVMDARRPNRRERHLATYPFIREHGGDSAVLVKLADRIANVEYSIGTADAGKIQMYRKEWQDFQTLIGRTAGTSKTEKKMWAHLDGLMEEP